MSDAGDRWRPLAGSVLLVVACGAVVAVAFWLLDLYLGDMPSPVAGFVAGAVLALVSVLRGWRDQRRNR